MDKASASGAGDSRFESWAGHFLRTTNTNAFIGGMVCLGNAIPKEGCEVGGDNVNRQDGELETIVFKEVTHTQSLHLKFCQP